MACGLRDDEIAGLVHDLRRAQTTANDYANEVQVLRLTLARTLVQLERYRLETPLGHQPHMIAACADRIIAEAKAALR